MNIFKNAKVASLANRNVDGVTTQYCTVLSSQYIYFYPARDHDLIAKVLKYFRVEHEKIEELSSDSSEERALFMKVLDDTNASLVLTDEDDDDKNKVNMEELPDDFNKLKYVDYFFIKGCDKIETAEDYQEKLKNQAKKARISVFNPNLKNLESSIAQNTTIRMINSMSIECVLEFKDKIIQLDWIRCIKMAVSEINKLLGRKLSI